MARTVSASSTKPTLYLLCGLAFAGKSTLATAIAARLDATVVSLDEINSQRGLRGGLGIPAEEWALSHQAALARAEDALARGLAVVVDDTNCFRFSATTIARWPTALRRPRERTQDPAASARSKGVRGSAVACNRRAIDPPAAELVRQAAPSREVRWTGDRC